MIDFQTHPDRYRHWKLSYDGQIAYLTMDVDEYGGLFDGYELKLNSYDLGVDIELYDAVQRLRFEHPEIRTVVIQSGKSNMFCAGANIRMLGKASHALKVNFCKFTNETRNSMEDATENSRQTYMCAVTGTAAGGGYELALATDHIILADDGSAAVALPEVPLLAVLPGTGGLTRLVDKRKVRRDLADVFCTTEEGVRGQRAVDWRLVDETVSPSKMDEAVRERAETFAKRSDRPRDAKGIELKALQRKISDTRIEYSYVSAELNRKSRTVEIMLHGPGENAPGGLKAIHAQGVDFWPLAITRELDDLLLHLRLNELELGSLIIRSKGDADKVMAYDSLLQRESSDWLVREIVLFIKRTLKRLDVTSRSIFTLAEPGSCFCGFLAEFLFAADRSYMLEGQFEDDDAPAAAIQLSEMNFGPLPMSNGLARLETHFLGEPGQVEKTRALSGRDIEAAEALETGLVTFAPDDIDWEDEIRLALEERASYSPDGLIGMEANLRFAGPETMETKIFGRLSAWQNWIFQRPNAVSEHGALRKYGTGERAEFDKVRV